MPEWLTFYREIIDESDVYIDVHKAIRRMQPAPRTRAPKGEIVSEAPDQPEKPSTPSGDANGTAKADGLSTATPTKARASSLTSPESPKAQILRRLSGASGAVAQQPSADRGAPRAANAPELLEQLRRLGPSNLASRPKTTRFNTVKIKPGAGAGAELAQIPQGHPMDTPTPPPPQNENGKDARPITTPTPAAPGGIGEGLLADAGRDAKDGVQAVHVGYGTMDRASGSQSRGSGDRPPTRNHGTQSDGARDASAAPSAAGAARPGSRGSAQSGRSTSTLGALRGASPTAHARPARSGSITENIVERGGVKKVVLETTSSSGSAEEPDGANGAENGGAGGAGEGSSAVQEGEAVEGKDKKKKRRKKRRKGEGSEESRPLMGDD